MVRDLALKPAILKAMRENLNINQKKFPKMDLPKNLQNLPKARPTTSFLTEELTDLALSSMMEDFEKSAIEMGIPLTELEETA